MGDTADDDRMGLAGVQAKGPGRMIARLSAAMVLLLAVLDALLWSAGPPQAWPGPISLALPVLLALAWLWRPAADSPLWRLRLAWASGAVFVALVFWPGPEAGNPAPALAAAAASLGLAMSALSGTALTDRLSRFAGGFLVSLAAFALGAWRMQGSPPLPMGLSVGFAALLLGLRLLGTGLRAGHQPFARTCIALTAGLCLLVMIGWALDSDAIVRAGTSLAPMPLDAALSGFLVTLSLSALLARHKGWALLLLVPVGVLSITALSGSYLGWPQGSVEWLPRYGLATAGGSPGHMPPSEALAWLLAALGIGLAPEREGRSASRWAATWACGLVLIVIAGVEWLGYLASLTVLHGWGAQTPMALPTGVTMCLLGLALVFAGASGQRDLDVQRSVWMPIGVGLAAVMLSLGLWLRLEREQSRLGQALLGSQADMVARALDQGMWERRQALARLAQRLAALEDSSAQQQVFARGAEAYLGDFASFSALAWLGPDTDLRQVHWRGPALVDRIGDRMDADPAHAALLARAAADKAAWSRAMPLFTGRLGELLVVPVPAAAGAGPEPAGFLMAVVDIEQLFSDLTHDAAAGQSLQVIQGARVLYQRGEPGRETVPARTLDGMDDARVKLWPIPETGVRASFSGLVLLGGLTAGGLLTLALRLAALGQRRAREAEHASELLRRQIETSERTRQALQAVERELAEVFDSISDAFYVLDSQWRFVLVNPRAEQLMRRPRDELLGRPLWECFPETRGTIVESSFRTAQTERRTVEFEVFYPPLGSWFHARVFPHPNGIAVYFQDVGDRKRAEAVRLKAEAASAHAQRLARLGSWEYDLSSGELSWSDEVFRIFGMEPGQLRLGLPALLERVHFEDRARLQEAQRRLHAGEGDLDLEYRVLRPDGEQRVVREIGTLLRDADGNPAAATGAIQDVTEQRAAQDGLREMAKRLEHSLVVNRQVMEHSLDAICVLDANGRFQQVSHAAREIWGHGPNELIGRAWVDLVHPDDRGKALRAAAAVMAGNPASDLRIRCVHRSGVVRVTQWSLRWSPRDRMTFAVARDVTALEAQARALRESEARMRSTVESALDCIVTMSADGRILDFNPAAERTFGYRREEVLGRDLADLLAPERLRDGHRQGLATYLRERRGKLLGKRVELPALRADGSELLVELTIIRLPDADPPVFTSFMRDVTEARRARAMEQGQREILAGIASRRPLTESLEAVTRLAEQQFPGSLSSVLLLDEAGRHVLTGAAPSLPAAYNLAIHGAEIGPKAGSCGTAAWRGETVIVSDIMSDPLWEDYRDLAAAHGLRACWSVPVKSADGKVLATFANYYRSVREPSPDELKMMENMAAIAAVAIEQDKAYRELALSEQRFRSLFEEHPDAVFSMDLEGRFTAVNRQYSEVTGLTAGDVLGKAFDFLVAPEHREMTRQHFRAVCLGEARQYEIGVVTPAGRRLEMRITNLPMMVQGRVAGVFGIAQDITVLRRHQQELGEALNAAETTSRQLRRLSDAAIRFNRKLPDQEMYQQLVDSLRDTIGAHQAVISLNVDESPAQQVHAVSLSEKYGQWRGYDTPPDGSGIYAMVVETARPVRMSQAELEAHPRWRGFGAEAGRHPPMRGWLAVPMIGAEGRVIGLLQLSDKYVGEFSEEDQLVTQQFAQMASDAIERGRLIERLRVRDRFFEMSAELFVIFEPASRRFVAVNPKMSEVTGYDREQLLARTFTDFVHPDDRQRILERADRMARGETIEQAVQVRYVRADGGVRWIEWLSSPGNDGLVYAVGRDITERRAAEDALRQTLADLDARNRELQDFAFIASHDLQEPLRKIRAFADRLRHRYAAELSAEAADYLERSRQAAERMQRLIDDLLAYSRVTRGKPFVRVALDETLATVLEDLGARLESSGGLVEAGPLPTMDADPTQMRQLLQNLVANALKFRAPERPPRVRISATAVSLNGEPAWELRVEDNGIGFEPRHAGKIFAPFQRLHGRQDYEGTGIGLAIVRRIVERHRGQIRAEGRPGEGACFVIQLPERQNPDTGHVSVAENRRDPGLT
ncbi:PAS domain S-box protein [Arenimonas fontis]|uniref:histidine kinase n=1 Tax=Arenimonas fontis TaxID=2608255 RepID=A0A5B2ZBW7_9GAMM|nr:PAS domain S-box protein [Arenimonas fontis]KAA2285405.1 PAS domain S-box protein [Arenimonas fontis]